MFLCLLVSVEVDSSTPVLFKKGEVLAVKPGFEVNAPSQVSKANFYIVMTESDVPDNPNKNHFVNFTGATFALATHVYTSMHKGRLHQQVCRAT